MRVLLVQPPHIYPHGTRMPDCFPLSLGYIASVLRDEHEVEVLDIWGKELSESEVLKQLKKLKENDYDAVGITAMSTQYNYVKWLANEIKKYSNAKIVVGGALATHSTKLLLENTKADFAVIGEGEITFLDLLKHVDEPKKVNGLAFKHRTVVRTPPRDYIKDLDSIPFPAWDMFPIEKYINRSITRDDGRKMGVIAGRGCPYDCTFCSKSFSGVRIRSAKNIADEIRELKKRYNIRFIEFLDELVVVSKKRIFELCNELEKLDIQWSCQGRLNIVDHEMLERMKKAGCKRIGYGIESGSPKIIEIMNKRIDLEQAEKVIADTDKVGITMVPQLMFGMVGETSETLQETISFCKRAHVGIQGMFTATPLPNTWLYDYAIKNGLIKDELKYLEGLTGCDVLYVNLTEFPDSEFDKIKAETVKAIIRNYSLYRMSHPKLLWKDYTHKLKRAYYYIQDFGIKKFMQTIIKAARSNPNLFFSKEF
ncbi:MAG: radical SAM protein [Candidatus Aenigmarchaeota archaeon]|nr:radical SAM protein [Candidatus Aenigmarchaeota archaeon]